MSTIKQHDWVWVWSMGHGIWGMGSGAMPSLFSDFVHFQDTLSSMLLTVRPSLPKFYSVDLAAIVKINHAHYPKINGWQSSFPISQLHRTSLVTSMREWLIDTCLSINDCFRILTSSMVYGFDNFTTAKGQRSAIALGSNLGDSRAILEGALKTIDRTPGITVRTRSSYYNTAPIGPSQSDFLNACALLEVRLTPQALLEILLDIERQFGRVRRERWGPRTLDLDILLFEDLILEMPQLQIPHPRMHERAFVLVPLAEIAPKLIEPVSGKAIAQLVEKVDRSGVTLSIEQN